MSQRIRKSKMDSGDGKKKHIAEIENPAATRGQTGDIDFAGNDFCYGHTID